MKERLYRFFYGRYGNDALNQFLFFLEVILVVLSLFIRNFALTILFFMVFILYFYRTMSRNIYVRQQENAKFINLRSKGTHLIKAMQKNMKDKAYKHFVCPKCSQIIRVPKGKGTIEITCPNCRTKFTKKA
ncbi:hypothetical protein [uncultured Faecalicoccus sp.]|uniref:hypothetical protein n=1 Tax=uncultured Faecalicoccus sp. TaxID=1971760 RepID=UPI002611BF90|nr:hypothetical protein [uncultured Faecalicoccus sp.]